MGYQQGHKPSHTGKTITEEPIKDIQAIRRIKDNLLSESARAYALFVVGINTAFRCGDLVGIKVGQVRGKLAGDEIVVKEEKTGKVRRVTLNEQTAFAIGRLLCETPDAQDDDQLFTGQRGRLTVSYVNRLVKRWVKGVGLSGQYGSHTLRKTWGYHQRVTFKASIESLMVAYNHSSQRQTLTYLCIQPDEMRAIYANCL